MSETNANRFRPASPMELEVSRAAIVPMAQYLGQYSPSVRLNILVGLVSVVALDLPLKETSDPMKAWNDDIAPAITKTIEANMPDWIDRRKAEQEKAG